MALRVGCVPYLHYEPFYFDMERRGIELVELRPNRLADALKQGEIDAAPTPLADSFQLIGSFEPVAGFGIACIRQAGSVVLVSAVPLETLDGARVALPEAAATASKLLEILLQLHYQISPGAIVSPEETHEARVLVGDAALRQRRGVPDFPHVYDLGEVWRKWTGLPLVFSRWMVRKEVEEADKALLKDALYVGLEDGVNEMYQVARPREDLLMLPRDIVRYIQAFRYYFGLSEQKAIDRFKTELDRIN